jgi:hypothetical protein
MPPLDNATPAETLGTSAPSTLSDNDFATEFGLASADGAEPSLPTQTAEDALEAHGVKVPASEEPAVEETPEAEPAPEGEEAPAPKPVTDFLVEDADGDEVDVSGVEVTFMANHEAHTLPLDRVVRLAQMGKYNEALQTEVKETRTQYADLQSQLEEVTKLAESRADLAIAASRAEDRLAAIARQQEGSKFAAQVTEFVDNSLYPAFTEIQTMYPSVSAEELWGRFSMATAHISRNGIIPPSHWREAMQVVDRDLGPFAAQLHDQRTEHVASAKASESAAVRKAQEEATRAKKMVAKAIRPAGSGNSQPPKRKAIVNSDDAVDDIIGGDVLDLVRSMRG